MIEHHVAPDDPDDPARNYTVAACDGCRAMCPQSRLPGRIGFSANVMAESIALGLGWSRLTYVVRRARGAVERMGHLCPACRSAPSHPCGECKGGTLLVSPTLMGRRECDACGCKTRL
jgi:hypothetical protein